MAVRTKITRTLVVVLRAAWILGTTVSASAETFEEKHACVSDAFQFCSSAIPNRDRVFGCLVANEAVISLACRSIIAPYVPVHSAPSQHTKRPLNVSSR